MYKYLLTSYYVCTYSINSLIRYIMMYIFKEKQVYIQLYTVHTLHLLVHEKYITYRIKMAGHPKYRKVLGKCLEGTG